MSIEFNDEKFEEINPELYAAEDEETPLPPD